MHLPALSHSTLDWIIIAVFALIVTFDALRSGSGRAAVLAVAFPIAVFFSDLATHTYLISGLLAPLSTPVLKAGVFLAIFAITYVLIYRIVYSFGGMSRGFLFALLSGISAAIITTVMWLQVPALQAIWHFGPEVSAIFGASYALLWIIAAYLILAFVRS